ncbi:hypothetical protein JTE90_010582 [Oedothorax gibbosus]|uniref:Uncharacterized protein n=1 Tax=Oedothorax gibbosus TaxID=931172 RepID=A0AAV6V535_9ARAC|nr:hypothetical protein JTE90_010582 [Oedothorax gibbosus]
MPAPKKKCICQLCTCGRHMCPHRKKEQLVLGSEQNSSKSLTQEDKRKQRKQWGVPNDKQDISLRNDQLNTTFILSESTSHAEALTVQDKGNRSSVISESRGWNSKQTTKTLPIRRPDNLKSEGTADFTTTHQRDFNKEKTDSYAVGSFEATSSTVQAESWNQKQIPKTQKIKKADTLTLFGPLSMETTHQSEYTESILKEGASHMSQTYQRPKTSLKLTGEFQSDSSYQQAFTAKKAEDGVKVQKGVSISHLKPEGEMTFDTTSLDYNTVSTHVSRASEMGEGSVALKPKRARPQSEIKIPDVPISDETTLVSDFKRWNVEKPTRHKPADTLQIGGGEESYSIVTQRHAESLSRFDAANMETSMTDHANWQVTRPVVQRPQNNLKPEGDFHFDTTHGIDYNSHNKRHSVLEAVTERTETESIDQREHFVSETAAIESNKDIVIESRHTIDEISNIETHKDVSQDAMVSTAEAISEQEVKATGGVSKQDIEANAIGGQNALIQEVTSDVLNQTEQKVYEENEISQSEDQGQYTWDDIRPKPIRPHSNLRQEGGMEFETTNRTEFVSRSMERVKGIRPKPSPKLFDGDFDATTMNQVMFSNNQAEKVSPIRPVSNLHVEQGGFVDETTSSREFQHWKVERPSPIKQRSNLTQEGTMDFTTMNQMQFEEKAIEKVSQFRPQTSSKITGDFDGVTTNQIMFADAQLSQRPEMIKPKGNLEIERGKFATDTTSHAEFQGRQQTKPEPVTPRNNLHQEGSRDFTTTNQVQYGAKSIDRVSEIRPKTNTKTVGDFDGTTTNQVMFQDSPREIDRPKPVRPVHNLTQEGSMDFTTTNQMQFEEKAIEKVSQFRPQTSSKITGDFDGVTTNQIMFPAQLSQRPNLIKPKGNLEIEKGKFATDTTNHMEFQGRQQTKPEPVKPINNLQQEGSRDFTTTNQVQYGAKTIERVSEIRPKTNTKTVGDFDGTTTNQVMFQDSPREKLKAIRPQNNIELDKGTFTTETTNTTEYQKWEYSKPSPIKPHSSMRQEGSMDFTTTNDREFVGKTAEKLSPIKPSSTTKLEGKFDGITTNQAMFKANTIERVKGKRPNTNIHLEKGKIESQTTASREFQQWEINRPEQVRPSGNLVQEGEMDFTTSNQTDFARKQITKVEAIRPHASSPVSGDFDGMTTNKLMFKGQTVEKVHDIRPTDNLKVDSGQFTVETTNSTEYGLKTGHKLEAIKPKSSLVQEGKFDFITSNQTQFQEKTINKVSQIRPKTETKTSDEKFDSITTNQAMYQTPEIEQVHGKRPNDNLHVESGKIDFMTSNQTQFQEKTINKVSQIRPKTETKTSDEKFDSITTNQAMYQTPEIKQIHGKRPNDNLHVESGKIDFMTSNQTQFQEKTINKVSQIRPKTETKTSDEKFDSITTNQAMYQTPEIKQVHGKRPNDNLHVESGKIDFMTSNQTQFQEKTINKVSQIRPKTETKTSDEKFDSITTNQAMYQTPAMNQVHEIRPNDNLYIEGGKFQSQTTSSDEYQQWKIQKPAAAFQLASSLKQEGSMQFETTNNREFKERSFDRVEQIRPKTTNKISEGEFDATTTNKTMFQQPSKQERVKPIRQQNNLQVESGKFDKETTNSRDFRQWVKVDNKGSPNKKPLQAAGVRTQKDSPVSKTVKESQQVKVEKEQSEYHPWKLNEDSSTMQTSTPKKKEQEIQQINIENYGNVKGTTTTTNVQTESIQRAMSVIEGQPLKAESIMNSSSEITNGNISNEGKTNISTTSQSAYIGQTGSRNIQNDVQVSRSTASGKVAVTSPSGDQLDRSPKRIEIESPRKTISTIERKQYRMENTSTMASDYAGKQTTKTRAIIPSGNIISEGEMTFSTTSQSDYVRQTGSRHRSEVHQSKGNETRGRTQSNKSHHESDLNFLETSGNKIISKSTEIRGKSQSQNNLAHSTSFEANTSLNKSSTINDISTRVVRRMKPDDNLKIASVPFEGTSTTKTEYTRIEGRRSTGKKPTESLRQEGKMTFNTTSNDYSLTETYNAGRDAMKAKSKSNQRSSIAQSGSMDFQTTSNSSFTATNVGTKSKNLRPRSTIKLGTDETGYESQSLSTRSNPETSTRGYQQVTSTSHASYVGHHTPTRTRVFRPTTSQKIGGGSFEGQTTSRSSFVAQQRVEKSKAIKPVNHNILNTESGSTGGTTYRTSFEAAKGHHCPVLDLQANSSTFTVTEGKNGHIFYAPQLEG